jgi:hypothetical protein
MSNTKIPSAAHTIMWPLWPTVARAHNGEQRHYPREPMHSCDLASSYMYLYEKNAPIPPMSQCVAELVQKYQHQEQETTDKE